MKRAASTLFASLMLLDLVLSASPAAAYLTDWDRDDTDVRLDIRRVKGLLRFERIGLGVEFYEAITRRRKPIVTSWYDVFGSRAPDFALRLTFYRQTPGNFSMRCSLVRLSDGERFFGFTDDRRAADIYCEAPSRISMETHQGIRWRVTARLQGVVRDRAPGVGWYGHL